MTQPILLNIDYNAGANQTIINPIIGNKPDYSTQYIFHDVLDAKMFIDMYYNNPVATIFAYNIARGV